MDKSVKKNSTDLSMHTTQSCTSCAILFQKDLSLKSVQLLGFVAIYYKANSTFSTKFQFKIKELILYILIIIKFVCCTMPRILETWVVNLDQFFLAYLHRYKYLNI